MSDRRGAVWRRTGETRRLLVVEHPDGSLEDFGFVRTVELRCLMGGDSLDVLEWKDEHGVPHTAEVSPVNYDVDGRLLDSIVVPTTDGATEVWHLDDAALEKIRRSA